MPKDKMIGSLVDGCARVGRAVVGAAAGGGGLLSTKEEGINA